ncbi:MAG: hypothetical protein LRS49_06580 [Desulfurococcales archaeon]|nr:hypothetical protein [Desulfurococcales archaeon]
MIVEYGVLNPLFKESPPLYIVAIPDPSIISEIGEEDYANAKNVSIDEAKIDALESMLSKIKEELNYAGVAGYTVIDTPEKLCELLFGSSPPKYAIIYWLQGAVPVGDVTSLAGCNINLGDLENYILDYHWVWVSPYGEPLGDATGVTTTLLNSYADIVEGPFNMSITSAGVEARREAYAFYLYNLLNFTYGLRNYTSNLIIPNATFYQVESGGWRYYGTVAAWVYEGSTPKGVLVLNLVHVDWDATGDGVLPETVVQQVVYSSLRAWSVLRSTVT